MSGMSQVVKHRAQQTVDLKDLLRIQPPDAVSHGFLTIDGAKLIEHEPGRDASHGHLGPEHIWVSTRGCRRDYGGGKVKIIRLKNHCVARSLLLVPHRVPRRTKPVHITTH